MFTSFMNRKGDILFTYPDVDLHKGDRVRFNGRIYLVVSRTFDVNSKSYEILLFESDETDEWERK